MKKKIKKHVKLKYKCGKKKFNLLFKWPYTIKQQSILHK